MTLAILQRFVPNQGTGWNYTLDALNQYLERVLAAESAQPPTERVGSITELAKLELPTHVIEAIGPYIESVRLLGERTAEMHAALSADSTDPAFSPEPFNEMGQQSIYQSMRSDTSGILLTLAKRAQHLPDAPRELAGRVLGAQTELFARFQAVAGTTMTGHRCRIHGDYHLGQVLYTGKDFVIIDFEGEPSRSLTDRRLKRSVLRDMAGMVRSFHYAAYTALLGRCSDQTGTPAVLAEGAQLEEWCRYWYSWVTAAYLRSYRETAGKAPFLPDTDREFTILLEAFVLAKAVYELGYELGHRPDWVPIPLLGILDILKSK